MKTYFSLNHMRSLVALLIILASSNALAILGSASATPSNFTLTSENFTVQWTVTAAAGAGHSTGTVSTKGVFINPSNGAQLFAVINSLSASGAAPYLIPESVSIPVATVDSWISQGISRVIYQRIFADAASSTAPTVTANVLITLPSSPIGGSTTGGGTTGGGTTGGGTTGGGTTGGGTTGGGTGGGTTGGGPEPINNGSSLLPPPSARTGLLAPRSATERQLSIQRLTLNFEDLSKIKIVEPETNLTADLGVVFSGSGLLQGQWQVADTTINADNALFRPIGVVRRQLSNSQRVEIPSPALPTQSPGKYILRFCVTVTRGDFFFDGVSDPSCPDPSLSVTTAYQVLGESVSRVIDINNIKPNNTAATVNTDFTWATVTDAVVYQLQIFSIPANTMNLDDIGASDVQPAFITGMLLPQGTAQTRLSDLVRSKLNKGQRYLWRISAHNQDGIMVGKSDDASFIYQ